MVIFTLMTANINTTELLVTFTPLLMSVCFFFLLLFIKKKKNLSDILLNVFVLFLVLIQLEFFLIDSGESIISLRMLIIFIPVFQSLAIVKYLYIKSLCTLKPLKKSNLLHFIPSALCFVVLLVINVFFDSFIDGDSYWTLLPILLIGGTLAINLFYIPKLIITYIRHKKNFEELFSYSEGVDLKWMRLSIIGYILFFVSIAFIEIAEFKGDEFFLPVVYTFYLFYLVLNGLKQKPISNVLNRNSDFQPQKYQHSESPNEESIPVENVSIDKDDVAHTEESSKYKSSSLKDDERIADIADALTNYLNNTKVFLNPGLNLMDVSKNLGINYKYISQAINLHLNKNFIRLISEYRVNEAKDMMSDPEYNNLKFEAIGELCGFQSKSTFYSAFKKITGKTPMQYKEDNVKKQKTLA